MAAHLSVVFHRTGKCVRLPPSPYTVSNLDVAVAVGSTCGDGVVPGIILNRKSIEVSVTTDEAFDDLIAQPHPIPNTDYVLRFVPCFSDKFTVTFYNVPLNATGATESAYIAAAGGTVLSHSIRRAQTAAGSFNTGERTFLCTGRSKFTSLPLAVDAYNGRKLGVRYRGQAAALAKLNDAHMSGNALSSHSTWGGDQNQPMETVQEQFDRHIREEEEEAERIAGLAAKSQGGAQQTVQPPENPATADQPDIPANAASTDNIVNTEQTPAPAENADRSGIAAPTPDPAAAVTTENPPAAVDAVDTAAVPEGEDDDPDDSDYYPAASENASERETIESVEESCPSVPGCFSLPNSPTPRRRSNSASDGERSRSPVHHRPPCRHRCVACSECFSTRTSYDDHLKLEHPHLYQIRRNDYLRLKRDNYDKYKKTKALDSCDHCRGFYMFGLIDEFASTEN